MHGNWGIILVVLVYFASYKWLLKVTTTWEGCSPTAIAPREKIGSEYTNTDKIIEWFLIANMWTLFIPTFMIGAVVYNLIKCGGLSACS